MVEFDPRFTQTLYLDTEWYVPPGERTAGTGSLIVNPARSTHALLGGVFVREFPLQGRRLPPEEIWGFDLAGEDDTLRSVYRLFERAWGEIAGRRAEHPDLVVVGIGVSRFDLPALFTRCLVRQIDRPERLFETFFHTKPVDLADFDAVGGTPAVRVLYPRTANQLRRARRPGTRKSSGTSVWRMFDEGRFDAIRARTLAEVEEVLALAHELLARRSTTAEEGEAGPR